MNIYENKQIDKAAKLSDTELKKSTSEKFVSFSFIKRKIKKQSMKE
jgi:hypothetical protein